ncbi:MAG TPA: FecR domain-containing protein [Candidatus Limnocylindria bacterium]|nr:FecR domain-containing protein [Candidatus Limnocylindria bacterium]
MKRLGCLLIVLLLVGAGVYLYLPRESNAAADNAATVAVLSTAIDAQKGSSGFAPALDGDVLANGDFVRSSKETGRAVLTFFDASTLSVDPGSLVKVLTLNRLSSGGIQLLVEQTLGRSWAAVSKLKTPDSKFEIKTPSSIAAVRGTAFETLVTANADGTTSVTYKVDDGQVLVTANAGGSVTVGPGQQVTINTNQPAPAQATPQAPTPRFVMTASTGVEFAVAAPTGATCGNGRNKQEIFGCVATGNTVTLREPPAGRYAVMLTKTSAAPTATLSVEAFRGGTREATRTFTGTLNVSDIVRSGFTYVAATPQTISEFEPAQPVTSVCSALAPGRVFDSGAIADRYAQLRTYAQANKNQAVAFVVTDADLTTAGNANIPSDSPATVKDLRATIDAAGVHLSAQASASVLTVNAASDVVAGPVDGKLVVRIRSLSASPLPAGVLEPFRAAVEKSLDEFSDRFPFTVRQVSMRQGCLSVMGTTP